MKKRLEIKVSKSWLWTLPGLALWVFLGAGCGTPPQARVTPPQAVETSPVVAQINSALTSAALQIATSEDYRLGPEDLLQITIFNIPEKEAEITPRTTEVRISQEGKITLPLLGDIAVAGLSPAGLEQLLRRQYDKYIRNPQIGVMVREYHSQQISVLGAVGKPGVFQLTGPKTLVEMLSMAGGIAERAGSQVHLYRRGPEGRQSQVIDLMVLASNPAAVNMPVQAGDVINVPQAGTFFVDGAVGKPGSYPLNRTYTLTQALTVAGGVTRTLASYGEIAIYRHQDAAEAERIPADLSEIWDGRATDPQIQADDVIVVPMSGFKYFVERFIGRIGLGSFGGITP